LPKGAGKFHDHAVERRIDKPDGAKDTWVRIAKLPATATEYSEPGLKKGERFSYRVRAINGDGESAYSNIARGAIPAQP